MHKVKEKFIDLILKCYEILLLKGLKEEPIRCVNCQNIIDINFDELRKCTCGCTLFVIDSKKYTIDKATVHCSCKNGCLKSVCHSDCDNGFIDEYVCTNCKNEISIYQTL